MKRKHAHKASLQASEIKKFRNLVLAYYGEHGRHDLPWRKTSDPYKILVSEVMLQQTQVERVKPYYLAFLKKFPNVRALANAPLAEVLVSWQGLGYNRRAKMLHEAAREIRERHAGRFPTSVEALESLRGIGPYTARAVSAFAYNADVVFIETNLRTVVTHHFFKDAEKIDDKVLLEMLAKVFPEGNAREWYSALMDYGAHLKRSGIRINAKSKTYTKQKKFEGSYRQARGAILRELVTGPKKTELLLGLLGSDRRDQMRTQLSALADEGLIELKRGAYRLPR